MTYKKIYMTFNIKRHMHARVIFRCEPVPGAVCSTRHSRISDQQRAPRAAQQCSWIPNQHGRCAWERAVFARGMPLANTAGWGSVGSAPATALRAAVGFLTNNAPHNLHSSAVGSPTSTAARGSGQCLPGACPWQTYFLNSKNKKIISAFLNTYAIHFKI